jgi:hypothetical protein
MKIYSRGLLIPTSTWSPINIPVFPLSHLRTL